MFPQLTDGRRVASPEQKKYQLTDLTAMHHEILRQLSVGIKPVDVARSLGITYQTVTNVKNTVLARAKMAVLIESRDKEFSKASQRFTELVPKAVEIVEVLLRQGRSMALVDPKVALEVAKTSLKLASYGPAQNRQVPEHLHLHNHRGATAEDLDAVRQNLLQAKADNAVQVEEVRDGFVEADIVDIQPTEEAADAVAALLQQEGFKVGADGVVEAPTQEGSF